MSTKPDRRQARRNKHVRTHYWDAHIEVAYLIARAEDESDTLAPRPSQEVPNSGVRPTRRATCNYVDDTIQ